MRILILADMEGISGIEESSGSEESNILMTTEVLSVVERLNTFGLTDITICDAHDRGENIRREAITSDETKVISQVWNVDFTNEYDVAFLIGFHGMAGSDCLYPHTLREDIVKIESNGIEIGEVGIFIRWLRENKIPTVFVSGDKQATKEALIEEPKCVTYTTSCAGNLLDGFFETKNELVQRVDSYANHKMTALIAKEELRLFVENKDALTYIRAKDKVRDGYLRFESYSELLGSMHNICEDLNNAMCEIIRKNSEFTKVLRNNFGSMSIHSCNDSLLLHLLSKSVYTLEEPDRKYIMKTLRSILEKT